MNQEPYAFQNIYLITTYRCNWDCPFCLFRFNEEKEAPIGTTIDQLEYSIVHSPTKVYIKITGGEPFIRLDLMEAVFDLIKQYPDKVYKVGIGTNGSIVLPPYFNTVSTRTHIFLSRHSMEDKLPTPSELGQQVDNPLIDFRINCNLIKGGVDSVTKIEDYLYAQYIQTGVTHYCFRELSKVNVDENSMYPKQIYDYAKYYDEHLITMADIEEEVKDDADFTFSRSTGNYYDTNHWYWYNLLGLDKVKLSVKFRGIDESKLIEFNKAISPKAIDEYVIHPDGTLTGCWDKDMKILRKGVI